MYLLVARAIRDNLSYRISLRGRSSTVLVGAGMLPPIVREAYGGKKLLWLKMLTVEVADPNGRCVRG